MTSNDRPWRVVLAPRAERDFVEVLHWTGANFGARQSLECEDAILEAIAALKHGPDLSGSRARDDIVAGMRTLHVGLYRKRARHFLIYRQNGPLTIEIARILHDSMDVVHHLPPPDEP